MAEGHKLEIDNENKTGSRMVLNLCKFFIKRLNKQ